MTNLTLHPMLRDISAGMDESERNAIGQQVVEEFRSDSESCQAWRDMHAEWLEIYFMRDRTQKPFEGASEDSLPVLAEACDQFHARASKAMFPGHGRQIIKCVPIGVDDPLSRERAKRVEKHMQWQLLDIGPAYRRGKDALLMGLPLHGSAFTKAMVDPITGARGVKNVRATDLIMPYGTGPRLLEDVPRKSEIIWLPKHHAARLTATGYFNQPVAPWSARASMDKNPSDDVVDDIMGFQEGWKDPGAYCLLIEQHRYLDLDGDGIEEPYVVVIDAITNAVVRIQVRYETDDAGVPTKDKQPWEVYTQFDFIPNPDGLYGIGHGLKIGAVNHALNRMLRINLDAAMLATVGNASGVINKSLGIKKGEIEMKLGKFITTETPVDDIRANIFPFQFPGPTAAGLQMIELLTARADRLSLVTEAVTGQTDKVLQPTTVLALLEQSNIVFSAVYERIAMAWESELQKVFTLNRLFMVEDELFSVYDVAQAAAGDPMVEEYMQAVAQTDYAEDFQVKVLTDPDQLTLKERVAKAEAMYQAVMANPITQLSPVHMRNALANYLEAIDYDRINEVVPTPEQVLELLALQAAQQERQQQDQRDHEREMKQS